MWHLCHPVIQHKLVFRQTHMGRTVLLKSSLFKLQPKSNYSKKERKLKKTLHLTYIHKGTRPRGRELTLSKQIVLSGKKKYWEI